MSAKTNGTWDFKSYNESTWFRTLVLLFSFLLLLYTGLHYLLGKKSYTYEYTKLNTEQLQVISQLYINTKISGNLPDTLRKKDTTKKVTPPSSFVAPKTNSAISRKNLPPLEKSTKIKKDSCDCDRAACTKVADYLCNTFEGKIDKCQFDHIKKFLCESNPQVASPYLASTRFKVQSYFWLIGPSVYWEVVFWSLFGVLCNLLFILGAVGSNATTDLANPRTLFDSSEVLGQVARLFYAPLCTLILILGYNFFKNSNVVDIDSSKGLLVFAFIGGYYSSRVISLMDRLKDLLLPNTGSASLPTPASPTLPVIAHLKIQLALAATVAPAIAALAAGIVLNESVVSLQLAGSTTVLNGMHNAGDPDGQFTFTSVTPGVYIIQAKLLVTTAGISQTLAATQSGQILSATAPITLTLQ